MEDQGSLFGETSHDGRKTMTTEPVYFNTTRLKGDNLANAQHKASAQSEIILSFFTADGPGATPSQVLQISSNRGYNWSITSIRRAMSVLTSERRLRKTLETRPGMYGSPEHVWRRVL